MSTHPHAPEAERQLIAGLMAYPSLLRTVEISPSDLYADRHRQLYALLRGMLARGEHIDHITVPERVMREGADRFGGVGYVVDLDPPARDSVPAYARRVRETGALRRLMEIADQLREDAATGLDDVSEIASKATTAIRAIGGDAEDGWTLYRDALHDAVAAITARDDSGAAGKSTGFRSLDEMAGGLEGGSLYIIAARPGMGKTGLALQIAEHRATDGDEVAIFSMEMGAAELAERTVVGHSGADPTRAREGRLTADEWGAVLDAVDRLEGLPVWVYSRPGVRVADLVQRIYARAAAGSLGLVVVDYLQLMRRDSGSRDDLALGEISRELKGAARALGIPVVLLSQLSRSCESRLDKRPLMSDLRGSGEIEQDADVIWMLYREHVYDPEAPADEVEILQRKHRRAGLADCRMRWVAGRFSDREDLSWLG